MAGIVYQQSHGVPATILLSSPNIAVEECSSDIDWCGKYQSTTIRGRGIPALCNRNCVRPDWTAFNDTPRSFPGRSMMCLLSHRDADHVEAVRRSCLCYSTFIQLDTGPRSSSPISKTLRKSQPLNGTSQQEGKTARNGLSTYMYPLWLLQLKP